MTPIPNLKGNPSGLLQEHLVEKVEWPGPPPKREEWLETIKSGTFAEIDTAERAMFVSQFMTFEGDELWSYRDLRRRPAPRPG